MRNLLITLLIVLTNLLTSSLHGQNTIEIRTEGDDIRLEMMQDGKLFAKTYESWKSINTDEDLQKFTNHFIDSCGLKGLAEGLHFDLSDGISLKSDKVDIRIKTKKKSHSLDISVRSQEKEESKNKQ